MRQRQADLRRQREAGAMQHARYECLSATLRRTLKRRSSSTYEASGCSSVTSASSEFSAAWPVTAICSSCKPAPLCSDGCGAAQYVHRVCRGGCDQFTAGARGDRGFALDRLIGPGHIDKSVRECTLRARLRACGNCLLLERPHRVAACNMRHETDGMCVRHASCNMQQTTSTLRPCRCVCGR